MYMTRKEFDAMMTKNPGLRVSKTRTGRTVNGQAKAAEPPESKGRAKYRNQKCYVYEDGFVSSQRGKSAHGRIVDVFDSVKEYRRWRELELLERLGRIQGLKRQVKLVIQSPFTQNGERIREIAYKADAVYVSEDGCVVVEDTKAFDKRQMKYITTKDFNIKWKLLKAKYPQYRFEIH